MEQPMKPLVDEPTATLDCQAGLPADIARHIVDPARRAALLRTVLLDTPTEEAFDRLTRLTATILRAPVALISLLDEQRQFFKSAVGLPEPWVSARETALTHSFCQYHLVMRAPLVITDAREHPLFHDNAAIRDLNVVAYAGVSLITANGHVLGALCAIDHEPRAWSADEVAILTDLAASVMSEIELRSVQHELEKRAQEAERERHEKLAVLERITDGFFAVDTAWRFTYLNQRALQLLQRTREELLGRNIWEEFPEAVNLQFYHEYHRAMAEQVSVFHEEFYPPLGVWLAVHAYPSPTGLSVYFRDITAWKQAETALRDSEERYRLLVEGAVDYAMFLLSPDGRVTSWNAGAERILGFSEAEMIGQSVVHIYTPEDQARGIPQQELRKALTDGRSENERWHVRKDGTWFWASGMVTPLHDQTGQLRGFAKVMRDITERKQAGEALARRERQQAMIAELGQRALARTELSTLIEQAVRGIAEILKVEYCKVLELQPKGDTLLLRAGVGWQAGLVGQATVSTGLDSQAGYTLQSNTPVIVEDLRSERRFHGPALLRDHQVISGMSVIIQGSERPFGVLGAHTTQRRSFTQDDVAFLQAIANVLATEIARERVEQALQASEARKAAMLESALDAVITIDYHGRVVEWNPAAEQIFGYGRAEATGEELATLIIPPAFREQHRQGLARCLAGADGPLIGQRLELVALHANGTEFPVELTVTKLPTAGPPLFTGFVRDITKRKQAEAALRDQLSFTSAITESLGEGVYAVDCEGRLTFVNPAAERLLGWSEAELLGKNGHKVFHFQHRDGTPMPIEECQLIAVAHSGIPYSDNDDVFTHKDGRKIPVAVSSCPIVANGQVTGAVVAFRDITERKQAEEALQQYAERLQILHEVDRVTLAAQSPETIAEAVMRHIRRLIPCHRASVMLFDPQAEEAIVLAVDVDGNTMLGQGARLSLADLPQLDTLQQGQMYVVEDIAAHAQAPSALQILRSEGISAYVSLPLLSQGDLIGALNLAITSPARFDAEHIAVARELADQLTVALQQSRLFAQVQAGHEQLQLLSRRLMDVQEHERRHLARELHDEIGQALTGLKLALEMIRHSPHKGFQERLDTALVIADELMARVRNLSLELRPGMLDDLGLLPALLWHFERYTAQTTIQVHFWHTGLDQRFPADVETAAYRIVQEALTNVARHAKVDKVRVRVWSQPGKLSVQIEDRGDGFAPHAAFAANTSSGLVGMRERTKLLGGRLVVESAPGHGTSLLAELPVAGSTTKP